MTTSEKNKNGKLNTKRQFCTFSIGRHYFGIDILDIKEIVDIIELTKIYHAPEEILGFINIRGHVHLIIDLRQLLSFEKKEIDEFSRILLFTSSVGESFGILVDTIGHMVEVEENLIEYRNHEDTKTNLSEKNFNTLEIAACKLKDKLLIILDSRQILKLLKK